MKRTFFALLLLAPALAQAQTPDHRGEVVLDQPVYRGERASAPIPPSMHVRNEGGSDGAGLCVISSILANGMYQGVPGLNVRGPKGRPTEEHPEGTPGQPGKGSALWRAAKSAPGGYSPDKLDRLLRRVMPDEKYAQLVGSGSAEDRDQLERISRAGYPVGVTMNTANLYGYQPIHHMVSLAHYRKDGYACVIDNNRPGFYSWMPAREFDRRWPDMGVAWAWFWTRLPVAAAARAGYGIAVGLLIVAGTLFALGVLRHRTEECEPCTS